MNWYSYTIIAFTLIIYFATTRKYMLTKNYTVNEVNLYSVMLGTIIGASLLFAYNCSQYTRKNNLHQNSSHLILTLLAGAAIPLTYWIALLSLDKISNISMIQLLGTLYSALVLFIVSFLFFNAKITFEKVIGIGFAIIAIYLIVR